MLERLCKPRGVACANTNDLCGELGDGELPTQLQRPWRRGRGLPKPGGAGGGGREDGRERNARIEVGGDDE